MERSIEAAQAAVDRYNAHVEKVERAEERLRRMYTEQRRLHEVCFAALPREGAGIVMGDRFEVREWSE